MSLIPAPVKAFMHYDTPVIVLDAPVETTDMITGKVIRVTGFWDNSPAGAYGTYVVVTGQKQKKDGTFYGNFSSLTIPIPATVREAFRELN